MRRDIRMRSLSHHGVDWLMLVTVLLVVGTLAALSVMRYAGYNAGMFDLGNMSQAIWSGTQGRPLEFTYNGVNLSRLALHVEWFYFLLVPLYALFPSPATLLIFQALFFGAGVWPLYALARRRIGSVGAARVVVIIYLFYPVAQTAVLFDFHGDTLAIPLLLFVLEALDRQSWCAYGLWLILALSCKFYVAAPVVMLGVLLWLQGQRRVGLLTVLVGVMWGGGAFFVARPLFSAADAMAVQTSPLGYLTFYFGQEIAELHSTAVARFVVAVIVFAPVLWLGWYARRWLALAVAVALPVLLSTGPGPSYHFKYHHYAMVVPFLLVTVIYGVARLKAFEAEAQTGASPGKRFYRWPIAIGMALIITLLLTAEFVDTPLCPQFWKREPGQGLGEWAYGHTSRDAFKDNWLQSHVPSSVPLATSPFLAPHLANREWLYLFRPLDGTDVTAEFSPLDNAEYVLLDGLFDYVEPFGSEDFGGGTLYDVPEIEVSLRAPDFGVVATQDGLVLFQRDPPTEHVLVQQVEAWKPDSVPSLHASFGDIMGLVAARIEPLGGRRFLLQYSWMALQPLPAQEPLFAVTCLQGVDNARILHLPTLALYPTLVWKRGYVVREMFEVVLPDDIQPGTYPLLVGWYDGGNRFAFATDARSRVGNEVQVGVLELR